MRPTWELAGKEQHKEQVAVYDLRLSHRLRQGRVPAHDEGSLGPAFHCWPAVTNASAHTLVSRYTVATCVFWPKHLCGNNPPSCARKGPSPEEVGTTLPAGGTASPKGPSQPSQPSQGLGAS